MTSIRESRVFKNTFVLYLRQIAIIPINLFTLSAILRALGVEDYGVYVAVSGMVALGSFLPGALASATQRFFAFAIGANSELQLLRTFSVNLLVYAAVCLVAAVAFETIGKLFVEQHLVLPPERYEAAQLLYRATSWAFVAGMITAPFIAILIAHEDMHLYTYLSVGEVLMKLTIAVGLTVTTGDRLELYGFMLLGVAVLNAAMHIFVCMRRYTECQFRRIYWDGALLKQIAHFTIWTVFGYLTSVARNQAVTILLNQTFNPVAVASRAIAVTVANQVMSFANSFNTGLYPSIIKSYAANEKEEMFSLVINGSKLTFFLTWIFALPMLLEMDIILRLWLNKLPEGAVLFTQLALIEVLIVALSLPLATAARAPGKMRSYELTLGIMQLGIFAVSWYILGLGYPPFSVFVVAIVINLVMLVVRLVIVSALVGLSIRHFIAKVLVPLCLIMFFSATPVVWLKRSIPEGVVNSILLGITCILLSCLCMYTIGLDPRWRAKIRRRLTTLPADLLRVWQSRLM